MPPPEPHIFSFGPNAAAHHSFARSRPTTLVCNRYEKYNAVYAARARTLASGLPLAVARTPSRPQPPSRGRAPSSCDGSLRFFAAKADDGSVRIAYQTADEPPFLQKKCGWLKLGAWEAAGDGVRWKWANMYTTSIHAVNSVVVKMARLTKVVPLYRGWTGATLPESFFVPDSMGVCGGVEFGFSSTTTDRAQAVVYAEGKASTLLELEMGMVDRGADVSWLSQCAPPPPRLWPPRRRNAFLALLAAPRSRSLSCLWQIRTRRRRCCRR